METLINLNNGTAKGYSISAGPINILFVTTGKGMIACGAFNVSALAKFNYPAVRVQSPVSSIEDVLNASAAEINENAKQLGITTEMTGRECLELMF